jgi:drug/metabolite transporter (DMT)-like permease
MRRVGALAVGLVLISACMHATWNVLAKRSADALAFMACFNLVALAIYAAPTAWMLARHGLPAAGVPFLLGSGTLEMAYTFSLAAAYRSGTLTLTYPVARGTGVLLVPLLAIPLLGERPTTIALGGVGLILLGLVTINVLAARRRVADELATAQRGVAFALLTGCIIATYSLVDKRGVAHVQPLIYIYGLIVIQALEVTPYVLLKRRAALLHEWRANRPAVLAGGVLNLGTYFIVLSALRLSDVSYIVPLRETSIVFGTLLGVFILHERVGRIRLAGCGLVALGVLAIALGG